MNLFQTFIHLYEVASSGFESGRENFVFSFDKLVYMQRNEENGLARRESKSNRFGLQY